MWVTWDKHCNLLILYIMDINWNKYFIKSAVSKFSINHIEIYHYVFNMHFPFLKFLLYHNHKPSILVCTPV